MLSPEEAQEATKLLSGVLLNKVNESKLSMKNFVEKSSKELQDLQQECDLIRKKISGNNAGVQFSDSCSAGARPIVFSIIMAQAPTQVTVITTQPTTAFVQLGKDPCNIVCPNCHKCPDTRIPNSLLMFPDIMLASFTIAFDNDRIV
ncbi:unnamed protein product, partial [Mesorhabditis belari]|uniref:Uncharacterized protein n=1 Tax=Mesorhabditis belari TaxID=2138241 RepID=A0AAF3EAV4_9BILA